MRTKKKFLTIGILVVAFVCLGVYAVLQPKQYSPTVYYAKIEGDVQLSKDNENWASNDIFMNPSESWFARIVITETNYHGNVTVIWQLQKWLGTNNTWVNEPLVKITKKMVLGVGTELYCVDVLMQKSGNFDWGKAITDAQLGDRFRIEVSFKPFEGAIT